MTREELKAHCEKQIEMCEMWAISKGEKPSGKIYEEHKLILELLDQQPYEDAISRQAVLDCFTATKLKKFDFILYAREEIKKLPPVTPQQKTGRWIYTGDYLTEGMLKCSECGEEIDISESYYDFCPVCGAKMQESEDKE